MSDILVTSQLSPQEYFQAIAINHLFERRFWTRIIFLFAAAYIVSKNFTQSPYAISLFIVCIWLVIYFCYKLLYLNRKLNSSKKYLESTAWKFQKDSIEMRTDSFEANFKYTDLSKIAEHGKFFYFFVDSINYFFLAKRFVSAEQLSSLRVLLSDANKNMNRRKRQG